MSNVPVYTHANAPGPIITITPGKPRAILSGVVFGWFGTCARCQRMIDLYAEDGQILIELHTDDGRGGARWHREHQVKRPAVPDRCPACSEEKWQQPGSFETPTCSSVGFIGWAVDAAVQAVYTQLGVDFPQAAEASGKELYDTLVIEPRGGS